MQSKWVEENEVREINDYLSEEKKPEIVIVPDKLKAALGVKTNVFRDLVEKWINYSKNIDFKTNANEIKKLADKVNAPGAKIKTPELVKYCKEDFLKDLV